MNACAHFVDIPSDRDRDGRKHRIKQIVDVFKYQVLHDSSGITGNDDVESAENTTVSVFVGLFKANREGTHSRFLVFTEDSADAGIPNAYPAIRFIVP